MELNSGAWYNVGNYFTHKGNQYVFNGSQRQYEQMSRI